MYMAMVGKVVMRTVQGWREKGLGTTVGVRCALVILIVAMISHMSKLSYIWIYIPF